jgi:hypothetical protein
MLRKGKGIGRGGKATKRGIGEKRKGFHENALGILKRW